MVMIASDGEVPQASVTTFGFARFHPSSKEGISFFKSNQVYCGWVFFEDLPSFHFLFP